MHISAYQLAAEIGKFISRERFLCRKEQYLAVSVTVASRFAAYIVHLGVLHEQNFPADLRLCR